MPEILKDMIMLRRGLILMVGASGSGKSTTLAAMIDYRNKNSASHIVTIEDPIEFLHTNQKSIVNQREVGLDTHSYHRALRSAMREAPDVILIGEIRDRETMQAAIDLAGTGHLAIATLHANNSPETLDRIINMYPNDQHKQVLMDLAQYVRVIISQRLVRSKEGKRVAAVEVMLNTAAHRRDDPERRHQRASRKRSRTRKEPGHAELRSSVVRAVSARRDQHGRGAVERRFAQQPRGEDQLRLKLAGNSTAANARVEHGPVDADALHRGTVRRCEQDVAARAAADTAGHELLERELTRKIELARELRARPRASASGRRRDLRRSARALPASAARARRGEVRHVAAVTARQPRVARKARRHAPTLEQRDGVTSRRPPCRPPRAGTPRARTGTAPRSPSARAPRVPGGRAN